MLPRLISNLLHNPSWPGTQYLPASGLPIAGVIDLGHYTQHPSDSVSQILHQQSVMLAIARYTYSIKSDPKDPGADSLMSSKGKQNTELKMEKTTWSEVKHCNGAPETMRRRH